MFEYIDEDGVRHDVGSGDVNAYLKEITGRDFTAKDFRTWAGTVLACTALLDSEAFDTETRAKKNLVHVVEAVAGILGNTRAVCRKSYIHPAVIDSYLDGSMPAAIGKGSSSGARKKARGLRPEEAAVLALLQQRIAREARKRKAAA